MVWKDGRRKGGRGYDIYGQRFSATGSRLGFNFRISGRVATADEFEPAAVFNPVSNEYLVVWQDSRTWDATQGWTIYGQRLSATGNGWVGASR